jgi:hypothetical protein
MVRQVAGDWDHQVMRAPARVETEEQAEKAGQAE